MSARLDEENARYLMRSAYIVNELCLSLYALDLAEEFTKRAIATTVENPTIVVSVLIKGNAIVTAGKKTIPITANNPNKALTLSAICALINELEFKE